MLPGTVERSLEWTNRDFENLIRRLQCAGYGWIKSEGVKRELENMSLNWSRGENEQ